MVRRCRNKKDQAYSRYGGRGITVCDRWLKFENFRDDMGFPEKGLTLDRIDNSKGYCKENCRWATREQQQNNTRATHIVEFENKKLSISQWARELGVSRNRIRTRLQNGWGVKEALFTPALKESLK